MPISSLPNRFGSEKLILQPRTTNNELRTKFMNEELQTTHHDHVFPLVSVCIGTYNREKYIRETLDSVFAQTYPNIEVIVVDDASTDGTVDLVREYGERVSLVVLEVNSGLPAVPRNHGLRLAAGKYVAFLDSDDVWFPEKLELQVNQLEQHPEFVLSHTYCQMIDEEGCVQRVRHDGRLSRSMAFVDLIEHCYITLSTAVVRRELLEKHQLEFNKDRAYCAREDYELFMRLLREGNAGCITEICASYRRTNSGISQEGRAWRSQPIDVPFYSLLRMRKDIWEGMTDCHIIDARLLRGCQQNSIYWRDHGYPLRSLYFCWKGIQINPGAWGLYLAGIKSAGSWIFRGREMKRRRGIKILSFKKRVKN